jgi:hypothetical protein
VSVSAVQQRRKKILTTRGAARPVAAKPAIARSESFMLMLESLAEVLAFEWMLGFRPLSELEA